MPKIFTSCANIVKHQDFFNINPNFFHNYLCLKCISLYFSNKASRCCTSSKNSFQKWVPTISSRKLPIYCSFDRGTTENRRWKKALWKRSRKERSRGRRFVCKCKENSCKIKKYRCRINSFKPLDRK